ncbi:MAG: low temperature requirement protein A [Polyangiaceae bacterium]|nr:low temperature requirement protein A [Polyangiaceae bacterium]
MAHSAKGGGGPHHHRPWRLPLSPRSPHEAHRVATPLELLFDLVVVVAVAQSAATLHHGLSAGHVGEGLLIYSMEFFGVWWAWVNFTWFASAYDNDDVVYRLLVFLQMTGALIFAGGISAFGEGRSEIVTAGYVIMRLPLVFLWMRAARADAERRPCAIRYIIGISIVQTLWVLRLWLPAHLAVPSFWALVVAELAVPAWAESKSPTTWHPHHIAERYSLFTIITLGESILSATHAVQSSAGAGLMTLAPIVAGGLLIVYGAWWLYFDRPGHEVLSSVPAAFLWGYGHYFVFASVAAIGAGISVAVDQATGHSSITPAAAGAAVAVPTAVYLGTLWFLHARGERSFATRTMAPLTTVAILFTPLTPQPVLFTGLLVALLTGLKIARAAKPSS